MTTRRSTIIGLGATALTPFVSAGSALAQAAAEREKQLYEAAKKEGELTWYTAQLAADSAEKFGRAFTAKYPGVKCNVVRTTAQVAYQRLNQELLSRVERSGKAFLSNAMVNGHFALRACIVNFRTTQADIEALLPLLSRLGAEVDGAMRS